MSGTKYATILTEESDDLRIRYLANKHIFQLFDPFASYNPAYLSNIISIDNNDSVLTMYNNWVGVGVTNPTATGNIFQVNNSSGNTQFIINNSCVGINTSSLGDATSTFNVIGSCYFSESVGIGTKVPTEKLRVDGNVQAFLFKAKGADYAEWEELEEGIDIPKEGTVVGFNKHGKITSTYQESVHFGVVSHKPSLLGNEKLLESSTRCVPIVYVGKANLQLSQKEQEVLEIGDFLLPKETMEGGITISILSRKMIRMEEYIQAIGYIHRKVPNTEDIYEAILRI